MNKTQDILQYIIEFKEDNDYAPVIREIQLGCGISSTSVVSYHINKLVKSGDITKDDNKARTIKINDQGTIDPVT